MTRSTLFDVRPNVSERHFSAVNIDELNQSLGLPGLMNNDVVDESSTHSHKSRSSQVLPDVCGRLIDRALDKPLTADALAQHLNAGKNASSYDTTADSRHFQGSFLDSELPEWEDRKAVKVVPPPPGFYNQHSREIPVEDTPSTATAALEPMYIPTGPRALRSPQRNNPFQRTNHARPYAHSFSSRRRPRAATRGKRTDQGPEPSAADIYPDDANWQPSQRDFNLRAKLYFQPPFSAQLPIQKDLYLNDVISWPTPAESYMQAIPVRSPVPTPSIPLNMFENHNPPTAGDINAVDDDVMAIIKEASDISIDIILDSRACELAFDERSQELDRLQENKYGMRFHGLALGDTWNPTAVEQRHPIEMRHSDHSGWKIWE